jgi:hypothetical protein
VEKAVRIESSPYAYVAPVSGPIIVSGPCAEGPDAPLLLSILIKINIQILVSIFQEPGEPDLRGQDDEKAPFFPIDRCVDVADQRCRTGAA